MTTMHLRRLAQELATLSQKVRTLEVKPQLGNSSLEDTALNAYDLDGQQMAAVGKQYDGTWTTASLAGPPPPQPTPAIVTAYFNGVSVRWDGTFSQDEVAPMDFSRVEVHVSLDPDFVPGVNTTLKGTLESPRGGDLTVPLPVEQHYVRLVARSQSGKASTPSVRVGALPDESADYLSVRSVDGTPTAGLDGVTGMATLRGLSVAEEPIIGGHPLSERFDPLPRGLIAYGSVFQDLDGITTTTGLVELAVQAEAGRQYEIRAHVQYRRSDVNTDFQGVIRDAKAAQPRYNSPIVGDFYQASDVVPGHDGDALWSTLWQPPEGLHRLLVTIERGVGGSLYALGNQSIEVYDHGLIIPNTGVRNDGGRPVLANPPTPPAAPAKVTTTTDFPLIWYATWRENGSRRTDTTDMVQGRIDSTNGNGRGAWGFPDLTGVLAGAVVERVEIFMRANHWYYNSGGTAVIGWHSYAGPPAGLPVSNEMFSVPGWPRYSGIWVNVTGWGPGIQNGTIRGVVVGPGGSGDPVYYGRFDTGGDQFPRVRITYTK